MDKLKPTVGQTLYQLNVGNSARWKPQVLIPVKVVKVGNKYFTVNVEDGTKWQEKQYHLSDWREKSEYSPETALYVSEQEWLNKKEAEILGTEIHNEFQYSTSSKLPLEALRKIAQIINENKN